MVSYLDQAENLFKEHRDALNVYGDVVFKLLTTEDGSAQQGTQSSPDNAFNASHLFTSIMLGVSNIAGEMTAEDIRRDSYWAGPAARAFNSISQGLEKYLLALFFALNQSVKGRSYAANTQLIGDAHLAALDAYSHHYDAATKGYQELVDFGNNWTFWDGLSFGRLAKRIDTWTAGSEIDEYDSLVATYWTVFDFFKMKLDANYSDHIPPIYDAVGMMKGIYSAAAPAFGLLPAGPTFTPKPVDGNIGQIAPIEQPAPPTINIPNINIPNLNPPGGGAGSGGGLPSGGAGSGGLPSGAGGSSSGSPTIPGLTSPSGGQLAVGADGKPGFDVTGNGTPDIGLDGRGLPLGDLPNARLVTGRNGVQGVDLDGDGIPDVDLQGRALPGGSAPPGSRLVTSADGTTGFDINGDGIPDLDLQGNPLPGANVGGVPGGQSLSTPVAGGGYPATPVGSGVPAGPILATGGVGGTAADAGAVRSGYPPMMPPMMPPQNSDNKNERETWLQEEEDVWSGDGERELAASMVLGRPSGEEPDTSEAEWEAPVRAKPGGPGSARPTSRPQTGARR